MFVVSYRYNQFIDVLRGTIVLRHPVGSTSSFTETFMELNPISNKRNPWFAKYWEQNVLNCTAHAQNPAHAQNQTVTCEKKDDVTRRRDFRSFNDISNVMSGVEVYVNGRFFLSLLMLHINGLCRWTSTINSYHFDLQFNEVHFLKVMM